MIDLSPETELLARRVADARHVTVDDAVREAVETFAQKVGVVGEPARPAARSAEAVAARRAGIRDIVRGLAAMPILDHRSPREIMDDLNSP